VAHLTESTVEIAALAWLENAGWHVAHGPDISPNGDTLTPTLSQRERESYSEVVLVRRLHDAQARLNDFDAPDHNDWLAVNPFTVAEGQHTRRPDVVSSCWGNQG